MKDLIKNLCGKLENIGINPIVLAKSIGIFIALVLVIVSMCIYPPLLIILCGLVVSILMTMLIYDIIVG